VEDVDRFLREAPSRAAPCRIDRGRQQAGSLAKFYDFVISRYQGDIHALFG